MLLRCQLKVHDHHQPSPLDELPYIHGTHGTPGQQRQPTSFFQSGVQYPCTYNEPAKSRVLILHCEGQRGTGELHRVLNAI